MTEICRSFSKHARAIPTAAASTTPAGLRHRFLRADHGRIPTDYGS
ncbi:hypothetical protein ATKI12_0015 [Kitasatospora sp. Ki12]